LGVFVNSPDRPVHPFVAASRESVRFATAGGPMRSADELIAFVRRAEQRGFDSCWYNDHPTRLAGCWPLLAAMAVATSTIRLFPLVSCLYYRSAAETARAAADVDRLSGGRLILGLGIGDEAEEFDRLGLPYPPVRRRQADLPGYLSEVRSYWSDGPDGPGMGFGPVQQGGIPVLIAGGGERVTLRQVAEHADMSNFGPHEWTGAAYDVARVARKLDALRRHCDDLGRDVDTIVRSHYSPLAVLGEDRDRLAEKAERIIGKPTEHFLPLVGTPDDAVRHFQQLADVGMQYFLVNTRAADPETLDLLAERVIPRVGLP
jgi:alkanesulfonate monooxygenase SsuD/methylene tetrahydromethanopterin reductase-like flavin-dependent oxidoreductase (luciferase family)